MARVVFLGTPDAAVPTLRAVAGEHEVALVVTQPDRPKGRSRRPQPPPIAVEARSLGLESVQPSSRSGLLQAMERATPFDLGVVVAYGRILRPEILGLPERGLLNVHFSLLPRWRGAAPVARALMAGDTMTGVTIIELDEGMDTGPVLTAQAIDIGTDEIRGDLTERLSRVGARLLLASMPGYLEGTLVPTPQTDEGATHADKIESSDRPIHTSSNRRDVMNQVRALAPTPAATVRIGGEPHKVYEVAPVDAGPPQGTLEIRDGRPVVGLADGAIELKLLQPPGKRAMSGVEWARGLRDGGGSIE